MTYFLGYAPPAILGAGTYYASTAKDGNGEPLVGDRSYRPRVRPNVPAKQFWAVTIHDLATAGFIREASRACVDSCQNTTKNPDGSLDAYFGPTGPVGKESDWIPTAPGGEWLANVPVLRTREGSIRQVLGVRRHSAGEISMALDNGLVPVRSERADSDGPARVL